MTTLTETETNHEVRLRNLEAMAMAQMSVLSRFLKAWPGSDATLEFAAQYFVDAAAKAKGPIDRAQAMKSLEYVDLMRDGVAPLRPVKEVA